MQRKKRKLNDIQLKPQKAEKEGKTKIEKKNKDNKQETVINMVNIF